MVGIGLGQRDRRFGGGRALLTDRGWGRCFRSRRSRRRVAGRRGERFGRRFRQLSGIGGVVDLELRPPPRLDRRLGSGEVLVERQAQVLAAGLGLGGEGLAEGALLLSVERAV